MISHESSVEQIQMVVHGTLAVLIYCACLQQQQIKEDIININNFLQAIDLLLWHRIDDLFLFLFLMSECLSSCGWNVVVLL